jgi:hypothetical protein
MAQLEAGSSLPAEGHFRAVYAIDTRVSARSAGPGSDPGPGDEAQFHYALGVLRRQVNAVQYAVLALVKVSEGGGHTMTFRRAPSLMKREKKEHSPGVLLTGMRPGILLTSCY